ncbi:DUF397 domain-containing protein [Streptomyces europaeiscabiei]|uniref:DUF397 domain-containing protein n=1 Tax=Streptomyces europaeiscabiei TaxID=146819 RepID=UPI0029BC0D6B|nr:DUF397 domain-containing protein [Streptomyces europaeiscabiei]MDX3582667.1 DUF397 domain-containing protein [Streptomyces europaeiscabiei]
MAQSLNWQKSTFSGGAEGNACVELTAAPGNISLRESDTPTTHLSTTPTPLAALLHHIKTGGPGTTAN